MTALLTLARNNDRAELMNQTVQAAGFACIDPDRPLTDLLRDNAVHAALIDAGMPWRTVSPTLDLLREAHIPIVFVTEHPETAPHLLRLVRDAACDVLCTPLTPGLLADCVRRLLERSEKMLIRGRLSLDTNTREAILDGTSVQLTAQESALLEQLMRSPSSAVSREELLTHAWGYLSLGETRTVDVHIQRLRRKLGAEAIETVYRAGYRLGCA